MTRIRCITARVLAAGVLQNPHYSTGADGIIVKANWQCADTPTTIYLSTHGFNL
jgi:hypothetical protein